MGWIMAIAGWLVAAALWARCIHMERERHTSLQESADAYRRSLNHLQEKIYRCEAELVKAKKGEDK